MADELESKGSTLFVAEYLEKKAPGMHEAFTMESKFNETTSEYEAKEAHREYLETLQRYESMVGEKLDFDPTDCSWAKVFDELDKAQRAAEEDEARGKGFLTKNRRKLARISPLLIGALQAIPEELKILQGGLAVVFNLAQHREENRRHILEAFEMIPSIISMAGNKSKNFPGDVRLRRAIDGLKHVLLTAIPNLVELLRPKTIGASLMSHSQKIKSPFQALDIESLLGVVRRCASQVEKCAEDVRDEIIIETHRNTEAIGRTATRIEESIVSVGQDMGGHFSGVDSRMVELRQEQQFMLQQVTDALSSQNGMFQMLKDTANTGSEHLYEQDIKLMKDSLGTAPVARSSDKILADFLQTIMVPSGQDIHDLLVILQRNRTSETTAAARAGSILASDQFTAWISSRGPYMLLVDAHLDPTMFSKISPMSFFCANLVQVFRGIDQVVTLHFFCSQHVASNDELCGPQGLVRSMIYQLARTVPHHGLTGPSLANLARLDLSAGMEHLCQAFQLLLRQFPPNAVIFCIIDDITRFERDAWAQDYATLMAMLSGVVSSHDLRFRLLMTAPTKSTWLQEKVNIAQHIELRGDGRQMGGRMVRSLWSAAVDTILPGP
ncbi:hypothetical protein GQ53DRAFT_862365 [Thozetella sp. PMI_491]|nr:hypothetical protein GQ53DRAFT_862365 [Thozetella sp. PMI_491]